MGVDALVASLEDSEVVTATDTRTSAAGLSGVALGRANGAFPSTTSSTAGWGLRDFGKGFVEYG
ncbi:hypothetical protein GCM10010389_33860 [Streptomyces echinoruber]|uniref:Uncharacterized protein n=1 Tax=Streptomyces echinoruber TaxID=68898 RepID=A0A918VEN7_9ACTN|nr:hypothetical protein GCM10010389_33860 [Streptomyces echinoruber]